MIVIESAVYETEINPYTDIQNVQNALAVLRTNLEVIGEMDDICWVEISRINLFLSTLTANLQSRGIPDRQ